MLEQRAPLATYINNPVGFCEDILGFKCWPGQAEILRSVRDKHRTSVAHCFAADEAVTSAAALLWWLMTRSPARVFTAASNWRYNKDILWREVRRLHLAARATLPGRPMSTSLQLDPYCFAIGLAGGDSVDDIVGQLDENILVIEYDAAGITPDEAEFCENLSGNANCRHLRMGVPQSTSGPFYDSHMDPDESKRWNRISINAMLTPNYVQGHQVVAGMVTREWVEDKRARWLEGGRHKLWDNSILGEFHPETVAQPEKVVPFSSSAPADVNSAQPHPLWKSLNELCQWFSVEVNRLQRLVEDNCEDTLSTGRALAYSRAHNKLHAILYSDDANDIRRPSGQKVGPTADSRLSPVPAAVGPAPS